MTGVLFAAFGAVGIGVPAALVSAAVVATQGTGDTWTAVLSGSGAAVAVSVLAWIARKVLAGEVVPLPVKEIHDALTASAERAENALRRSEERLAEQRQWYERRDAENREMVKAATEALFGVRDWLLRHEDQRGEPRG